MEYQSKFLLVAAIDFGTTYSGYAFSTRAEFLRDPLSININQAWNAGTRRLCSLKTPTCLLLDQCQEFVAFGYEAEDKYAELVMDEKHEDYYYFERFKMTLHNNPTLDKHTEIKDITGKPFLALDVFALSTKALKDHLLQLIKTQGADVKPDEIQWVLTVPAIWTEKAKQFMRKSAEKAGIPSDQLLIALEPEAASIYHQYRTRENHKLSSISCGTTYMIVDLGGGTVDIIAHKKTDTGVLKEVCRATGGSCGGQNVNEAYLNLLQDICKFPKPLKDVLCRGYMEDYLDLIRDFEVAKRTIKPENRAKVNISIPYSSLDNLCKHYHYKSINCMLESSPYRDDITFRGAKLQCKLDVILKLFDKTIQEISAAISDVLRRADVELKQIVLVGGFSESQLVKNEIQKTFSEKTVIVPKDCGLSVLQGAVLFGHRPDYIGIRVMQYTYGIKIEPDFDASKYDDDHRIQENELYKCKNVFSKIIRKDTHVKLGEKVVKTFCSTVNLPTNEIRVFCTKNEKPKYTDEEGCIFVGKLKIKIPEPLNVSHTLKVGLSFGTTEISVETKECTTGRLYNASFNTI